MRSAAAMCSSFPERKSAARVAFAKPQSEHLRSRIWCSPHGFLRHDLGNACVQEIYSSRKHSRFGFFVQKHRGICRGLQIREVAKEGVDYEAGTTGTRGVGPMDLTRKAVQPVGWPESDRGVRADATHPGRYCGQTSGGSPARASNSREMDSERNHRPSHRYRMGLWISPQVDPLRGRAGYSGLQAGCLGSLPAPH